MYENKYSKVLTVILIIVILGIVGVLSFFGFEYYKANKTSADGTDFVNAFKNEINNNVNNNVNNSINNNTTNTPEENNVVENAVELNEIINQIQEPVTNNNTNGSTTPKKQKYQGYTVLGTIEIPATSVSYPILEEYTKTSIEIAVSKMYGVDPNEVGNMVLSSHNYRNGKLFSNNKKLSVGDVIYITDLYGNRVKYTIYKKYETTPEDTEYMKRDTAGLREISLSTCTDDSSARLIIWAKAD